MCIVHKKYSKHSLIIIAISVSLEQYESKNCIDLNDT